jgi:hypothetical protein
VPVWAKSIEVKINGEPLEVTSGDGRIVLQRDWKPGEAVELCYQLASRIERRPDKSGQLALFHGPWLLQIDRVTSPVFFESGYSQNRVVLPSFESEGDIALEPARPTEVPIGPFRVPVARFKLTFIPGGFRSQPLMATLSAAAERTAQDVPPLAEFWLEPRKEGETFTNY